MPSTFSSNLRLELIGAGEQAGVWNRTTNSNLGDLIEAAISGATNLDVGPGDITLTALNGVPDQARSAVLIITGTPGATRVITIPNVQKPYTVKNRSNSTVQIKTAAGTALSIPTLAEAYIFCDGNNGVTGRIITDGANAINSLPDPFNNAALTGVPTAPTPAPGTNTTQIATTAFVQTALPIGSIIMWYGLVTAIPFGWQLCDGTNGTPDLRDRFVVGAGGAYAKGDTGGADSVTLTTAQIPSHTHTGSGTTGSTGINHTHSFSANTDSQGTHSHSGSADSAGAHQHIQAEQWQRNRNYGDGSGFFASEVFRDGRAESRTLPFTSSAGAHTHSLSINNAGAHTHSVSGTTGASNPAHTHSFSFTTAATGGGQAHENRPPYHAVFFIMRV